MQSNVSQEVTNTQEETAAAGENMSYREAPHLFLQCQGNKYFLLSGPLTSSLALRRKKTGWEAREERDSTESHQSPSNMVLIRTINAL